MTNHLYKMRVSSIIKETKSLNYNFKARWDKKGKYILIKQELKKLYTTKSFVKHNVVKEYQYELNK